jgi:tetrahydromethanopterin S-methyltransferase subunit E
VGVPLDEEGDVTNDAETRLDANGANISYRCANFGS